MAAEAGDDVQHRSTGWPRYSTSIQALCVFPKTCRLDPIGCSGPVSSACLLMALSTCSANVAVAVRMAAASVIHWSVFWGMRFSCVWLWSGKFRSSLAAESALPRRARACVAAARASATANSSSNFATRLCPGVEGSPRCCADQAGWTHVCWGMLGSVDDRDRQMEDSIGEQSPFVDWVVGPGEPDNSRFGELLEGLRWKAGLSRADAAAKLGLSSEYLRLIEVGKRTPALGQMRNLLDAYGAEGEVERISPQGYRQDLVVFDPLQRRSGHRRVQEQDPRSTTKGTRRSRRRG